MIPGFINIRNTSRSSPRTHGDGFPGARRLANRICERLSKVRRPSFPLPLPEDLVSSQGVSSDDLERKFRSFRSASDFETFVLKMLELSSALEDHGVFLFVLPTPNGYLLLTGGASQSSQSNGIKIIGSDDFSKNIPAEAFGFFINIATPTLFVLRNPAAGYYDSFLGNKDHTGHFPGISSEERLRIREEAFAADNQFKVLRLLGKYKDMKKRLVVFYLFVKKAITPYQNLGRSDFARKIDEIYLHSLLLHELHHLREKMKYFERDELFDYLFSDAGRVSREYTAVLTSLAYSREPCFDLYELISCGSVSPDNSPTTSPHQILAMHKILDVLSGVFGPVEGWIFIPPAQIQTVARLALDNFYSTHAPSFTGYDSEFQTRRMANEALGIFVQ